MIDVRAFDDKAKINELIAGIDLILAMIEEAESAKKV